MKPRIAVMIISALVAGAIGVRADDGALVSGLG